jgi:taurine dioxygenase
MPQYTELTPLGAVVPGLRVDALDDLEAHELRMLLAERGVIVLPGQDIDDDAFLRFLRSFGEPVFTAGETPVPGFPDLNLVSNVGRTRPPRSTFHTDTSYVRKPPAYTALRAVRVPGQGGHTLFTDQYAAYETLPSGIRGRLDGRSITHVVTGLDLDTAQETQAVHPVLLVHPLSGRTALYLSTPKRCAAVSGMSPREAADTVSWLFRHSTRDDNVYRHEWSHGDVVMWDNRCVLHCADHTGVVGDRVMHRGMVADQVASVDCSGGEVE